MGCMLNKIKKIIKQCSCKHSACRYRDYYTNKCGKLVEVTFYQCFYCGKKMRKDEIEL